ncbi:MAG: hypothetical protein ABI670_22975 [Chloroflexota bacterium]
MADKKELRKQKGKARRVALEGLRSTGGFPVPPRKAMSQAKKRSKALDYPIAPYAGYSLLSLFRWGQTEWQSLGKWQKLTLPVVAIVTLTTWEKELELREKRWEQIDREESRQIAATSYGAYGPAKRKKSLLSKLPLPWRKK